MGAATLTPHGKGTKDPGETLVMLKFFFDRFSKVVYMMEALGVALTLAWLYKRVEPPSSLLTKILLFLFIAEYLGLRFCASVHWHKNAARYEGIELHFKKAMIPTAYILAFVSGMGFFAGFTLWLWPGILLLGILLHANIILLYLHFKDKNKTPVNYYSNEKFR